MRSQSDIAEIAVVGAGVDILFGSILGARRFLIPGLAISRLENAGLVRSHCLVKGVCSKNEWAIRARARSCLAELSGACIDNGQ
jgi:hypothetical protein